MLFVTLNQLSAVMFCNNSTVIFIRLKISQFIDLMLGLAKYTRYNSDILETGIRKNSLVIVGAVDIQLTPQSTQ